MAKSIVQKVHVQKLRRPAPTPKERMEWDAFMSKANMQDSSNPEATASLQAELNRLVANGNPLAHRFAERLQADPVRGGTVNGITTRDPKYRRMSAVRWGRPGEYKEAKDDGKAK